MTNTKGICLLGAVAALATLLAGCGTSAERTAVQTLHAEAIGRTRARVGGVTYSRARPPGLRPGSNLNDYLACAALNNPQLEAAFNRWKAALEMVLPARTLPDPRFNFSYFIQEVETRVGPQEYNAGISQTFPWFGKLKLRGQAALAGADAAQQQYESAKLALFDEVQQAYYELYYLGRAIAITKENVGLLEQFEQIAESRYRAGTAANGDVLKAQVELDKLRDRLRTLKDLLPPSEARLNAALNRPAEAPLPIPTNLGWQTRTPRSARLVRELTAASPQLYTNASPSIEGLLAELQTNNPDLKSLDYQAQREERNVALARKEFYPDVTLGVGYAEVGPARMSGVEDSGKDPVFAGFSVNVPVWWGKYRAEVRGAQSRWAATRQQRQDLEDRLSTNLKLAAFKFQDAQRKIVLYRDALIPKADENLHVIQRSYQAGTSDFLSLIDAERVLLEFQLTYERAVADREQGLATVEKLVGETWP